VIGSDKNGTQDIKIRFARCVLREITSEVCRGAEGGFDSADRTARQEKITGTP
jgi:hypothetical protein